MNNYLSTIPEQWLKTNGIGTKIGIIDAGFDCNNKYIKDHITAIKDYGSTDIDHGTHVMGIMCINRKDGDVTTGLAQYSNYYLASIPMGEKNGMKYMCEAISDMISFGVDVLNMSFTNYMQNQTMKKLLFELHKRNTILVAAYSDNLLFPHSYPFVISAGNQLIAKNNFYSSVSNDKFKSISGTSMQCAYISSVVATAKAYDKNITKEKFLRLVSGKQLIKNKLQLNYNKQVNLLIKR